MKRFLLIALLLLGVPLAAQEAWYLNSTAGPSCSGFTIVGGLQSGTGSSNTSEVLGGSETTDCWTYDEDRTIVSGSWTANVDINCDSGGGPGPEVDIRVRRLNSSCVSQDTLIGSAECAGQSVTKGATVEVSCTATGQPSQAFADTEFIRVCVWQSRGSVTCRAQFENSTTDWDSRIGHPGAASARRRVIMVN